MKFKISSYGYDGRKFYTIKKIIKDSRYSGGYKVILNETDRVIALGYLFEVGKYNEKNN